MKEKHALPKRVTVVIKDAAEEMPPSEEQVAEWLKQVHSADHRLALNALIYLTDLKYGKAREAK